MELLFSVVKQVMTRTDSLVIASHSRKVHSCSFTFSEEWQGMEKSATFKKNHITYDVLLDNDTCTIPSEVLRSAGAFEVGVYGSDGQRTITSNLVSVEVVAGSPTEGLESHTTPSMYEQIMEKIKEMGEGDIDPEAVEGIVADYVAEHKDELKGDTGAKGDTGESGKSAYEIAVENGYSGTEAEWLASLKGEKGDSGEGSSYDDTEIKQDITDIWKVQGELGAKNLIPYPYPNEFRDSVTSGVTFTINNDGSITLNGTATANIYKLLMKLDLGDRPFSSKYNNPNVPYLITLLNGTSSVYCQYNPNDHYTTLVVENGATIDNLTVYPMLRYRSDTDNTWQPYAPTNYQLNQKLNTIVSGKSAYQIAVDNGFSGTESEWLASLKGEKGDSGSGGATSDLSIFCDNIDVDYAYDSTTNANYTIIRIYRDKIDGSKQYPFVYAPNGANACEKTSYDVANEDGWLFTINGGVFNTNTHIADGMLIQNGIVLKNRPTEYHSKCRPLTIDSNGQLGEADYDADANTLVANGIMSAVCGFMAIIKDFAAVPSSQWNTVAHYTENVQRQIFGQFGNGDYAIITCEGRNFDNSDGWTIEEAQNICIKHGLKFAYNLDGGGSTETMLGLKHFNRIYEGTKGRKVPTFIVFNGKTNFDVIPPKTEKTLSSITANKTKISYSVGDSLNIDDITVIANYSDGTITDVTNSVQINTNNVDMSNNGNYSIIVTYTEDGITKSCNISIQVQSGSEVPSEKDYEFILYYPPLYDNNVLQTNYIAGRAGAWTQTPNDAPAKAKSTDEIIGYLIPIPQDAVGVTVTTTDVVTGLSTYNIVDGKPTRLVDAGWGKTVGTNSLTFNKGEYEYLAVNCKRSNNTGFDPTTDTSAWEIEWSYNVIN